MRNNTLANANADAVIKLLVLGDGAVGKTSILLRYCEGQFDHKHILTIGVDLKTKIIDLGDEKIRLQIWDTAGQERFRNITPVYFRNAMGVLLCFDVTSTESFENVTFWLGSLDQHASPGLCKVLVGNKIDLKSKRVISSRRAEQLATRHGILYYETSARENVGIDHVFESLAARIRRNQLENPSDFQCRRGTGGSPLHTSFVLVGSDEPEYSAQDRGNGCCGVGGTKKKKSPTRSSLKTQPRAIHFDCKTERSPLRKQKTGLALERLPSVSPTSRAIAPKRTARLLTNDSPMKTNRRIKADDDDEDTASSSSSSSSPPRGLAMRTQRRAVA